MRLRCLSVWQPWPHLMVYGDSQGRKKTIETRAWPSLPRWLIGQRLGLHAAVKRDKYLENLVASKFGVAPANLSFGCLIGHGLVCDVRRLTKSDEAAAMCECEGRCGIVLTDVRPFDAPVRVKGKQGFFFVDVPDAP